MIYPRVLFPSEGAELLLWGGWLTMLSKLSSSQSGGEGWGRDRRVYRAAL